MATLDVFIEQAEYIERKNFNKWYATHPDEEDIIKKLTQIGAKLITGPRGSGKTTLLLKAHYQLLESKTESVLPVYVNFKASLKLEPLYKTSANANYWFNQWVMYKIYEGIYATLEALDVEYSELKFKESFIKKATRNLEYGNIDYFQESDSVNLNELKDDIHDLLLKLKKTRCNLYLDDAAHAFSPEQQRGFFDFFREIKSKTISPKAAIYPGVTMYSPSFHIGHDAQSVDIWIHPDAKNYLEFMYGLIEKRLTKQQYSSLMEKQDLVDLLCFSAFGVPRALLNMIQLYLDKTEEDRAINFDSRLVNRIIKDSYSNSLKLFKTLEYQIPIYKKFIEKGLDILDLFIDTIKDYNKGKTVEAQAEKVALVRPVAQEIEKVVGFLQYSGLVMYKGEVERGEKGRYEIYTIHYAGLIYRNAFFSEKFRVINRIVNALKGVKEHRYTRLTMGRIFNEIPKNLFELSLPPCPSCKSPRINESARFCFNCGAQLTSISVFDSLVKAPIERLPLTKNKIEKIKNNSRLKTIRDILMDHENKELRKVPSIGAIWADRIKSYAEEFLG